MKRIHVILAAVLCTGVQLISGRQTLIASAGQEKIQVVLDDDVLWTRWGVGHYAMADDGDSIWIGTANGLIRWNKSDNSHTRYSPADGLPLQSVLAVAVDGQGNRWFGGDGWLVRLDPGGIWTLIDLASIGLTGGPVDGIAAGTDGTVWLSHLDSTSISQLNTNGTWVVYSDRKTAVAANYPQIRLTVNKNKLWTVSGDDVWVNYERYDGSSWQTFTPPQTIINGPPLIVDADSMGNVWFLSNSSEIRVWDGQEWLEYSLYAYWSGSLDTLVVGENDEVWVGWQERCGNPYAAECAGISRVPDTPGEVPLDTFLGGFPPVVELWPTEQGVWATGPAWLLLPGGEMKWLTDVPVEDVSAIAIDKQGRTWIHPVYGMQTLDDQGTPTLADDESGQWIIPVSVVNVIEPAANGDLWIAGGSNWRFGFTPRGPARFYGLDVVVYTPPRTDVAISDIFVQDDGHAWIAYGAGIWSFDDGGTPADLGDDIWDTLAPPIWGAYVVALQGSQLWAGNSKGLYVFDGVGWERVRAGNVTDLVPASDGSLFAGVGGAVLVVGPEGEQSMRTIEDLAANDLAQLRLTQRRNRMWTVAPDGAVWYWKGWRQLARRDEAGLQLYQSPVISGYIEVDENNHVWLAEYGTLWRMSERPDFDLEFGPSLWLMEADDTQTAAATVAGVNGFMETVTLTVEGLPAGVSAVAEPNPVPPGGQANLLLTSAAAPLGEYEVMVQGRSNFWTRQRPFRLIITERIYDTFLPLVAR